MVTVDNIGTYGASSSRNQFLSRILESVPYPEGYPERGFVVENKGRNADQRKRQAPIEIEASDDGKTWRPVYSDEEARETYRADLSRSEMRVRYVRVRRKSAKDNEEPFRLSKILVYGRKLY